MQKKNGFVEFHHFMKKERLTNPSKTFLNQWEPMGKFPRQDRDIFILPHSIHRGVRTKQRKGENQR